MAHHAGQPGGFKFDHHLFQAQMAEEPFSPHHFKTLRIYPWNQEAAAEEWAKVPTSIRDLLVREVPIGWDQRQLWRDFVRSQDAKAIKSIAVIEPTTFINEVIVAVRFWSEAQQLAATAFLDSKESHGGDGDKNVEKSATVKDGDGNQDEEKAAKGTEERKHQTQEIHHILHPQVLPPASPTLFRPGNSQASIFGRQDDHRDARPQQDTAMDEISRRFAVMDITKTQEPRLLVAKISTQSYHSIRGAFEAYGTWEGPGCGEAAQDALKICCAANEVFKNIDVLRANEAMRFLAHIMRKNFYAKSPRY